MSTEIIPIARGFDGEEDLARLVPMLKAVVDKDRDGLTVSIDDLRFEWIDDEEGWVRNLQVWEAGDKFVASFGVWHETADALNRAYGMLDVHPDWREPVFVDEVVFASVEAVSELIDRPVEHRVSATGSQEWKQAGLARAGFVEDRYYHRMSAPVGRSLPSPHIADGFQIRPFAGESEIEEWVATFNRAYVDHHDSPTTTVFEKRHRMEEPGYIPAADLVLTDADDRIVGIGRNSSERLEDGTEKAWVNTIAILPEHRGKGLGRALLLSSMHALKDAGYKRVHLSVDSDNPHGAQQLYTSAGFAVDSRIIVYMRVIEPA